jgi:hypothetical protein
MEYVELKNSDLFFIEALLNVDMNRKDNKNRMKFLRYITPHIKVANEKRDALHEKYAKKDETGAKVIGPTGLVEWESPEAEAEATKEFKDLMDSNIRIDVTEANSRIFDKGMDLFKHTEKLLGINDGEVYERILEAFGVEEEE